MGDAKTADGHRPGAAALTLAALGIVFGDIGTSPLYAMQTVFSRDADRVVPVNETAIYGSASLIFWAILIIITLKYVTFIMGMDNDGEGGIMSLIALLQRTAGKASHRRGIVMVLSAAGIFGASLFFGDSMITPAISVLSAVEGLQVVSPGLHSAVVPITAVILIALFFIQQFGTQVIGRLFGPVMLLWFFSIAAFGVHGILQHPGVLAALSPTWAVKFFLDDGLTAFLALGGVVLAVTGAEAIYADMGHFGRNPIRRAWLLAVFPALTLNYLGQGAQLAEDPGGIASPFFLLIPHWARLPMVVLATMATVIASQAVISGAFSVARQAIRLGYLPRITIRHTSEHEIGQVYAPLVNWVLLAVVLILVFAFEKSQKLAAAYGVAVCGTILLTLTLFLVVSHRTGNRPLWQLIGLGALFGSVDVIFLASNLTKIPTGGWLPLVIAGIVFTILSTWQRGRQIVTANRSEAEGPLEDFVLQLHEKDPPIQRVPGTAVFLNRDDATAPLAMRENVEHNRVLHKDVVILTIETESRPHVPKDEQLHISDLGFRDDGISHVTARVGYLDQPDVPDILRRAEALGLERHIDCDDATYFLSKIELIESDDGALPGWRKKLFLASNVFSSDPAEFFALPRNRTVLLGSQIEL